jgi:hypothetical protein
MKKYMCGTTFKYELGWADDVHLFIYDSVEDVKSRNKCWEGCGIVKIDVDSDDYDDMDCNMEHVWVVEQNMEEMFRSRKTIEEWEKDK